MSRRSLVGATVVLATLTIANTGHLSTIWAAQELAVADATLSFTDVTAAAGMSNTRSGSHGAFWADATGDGWPDVFLTYNECRSGERTNRFYRNLGNGTFADETSARGLLRFTGGSHGGAFADVDNDGDYDLLVGNTYLTDCVTTESPPALANQIFRNDGGFFVDRTPPAMAAYPPPAREGEGYTRSILGFDMDGDGDIDVFAVNGDRGSFEPLPDRNELYRNNGGFNFSAITSGPLVTTPAGQAAADTDYDGDGDVDILMPDFGGYNTTLGDLGVLRNDGNGVFTRVPRTSIGISHRASTGISSGDLNNDGRTDLILIDQDRDPQRPLGFDRIAYVYLSAGGGTFSFAAEIRGIPGYTAGLADLDNDGDLDLTFPGLPAVLLNDGAAHFTRGPFYPTPTPATGCISTDCTRPDPRTVSFADVDNDGDLDSLVTSKFGSFYLIRNNLTGGGNWLKVQLTSSLGQAGAFGAKVRVYRAGTNALIAMREAKSVYGYLSQDDPVLHFGLGPAQSVDVDVTFLDGGHVTRRNVSVNQTIAFMGTTAAQPPGAPRNLTSSVVGSTVNLSWDLPADGGTPTNYHVEAGNAAGLSNLAVLLIGPVRTFTATAANGVYYVRVRGRNAAGVGPASNEVAITVGGACVPPNAPGNLGFAVAGSNVTLSWSAPAGGVPASYLIDVGSSSGLTNLVTIDTGGPILTVSAVAPPGRYFVRVRATNPCGAGPPSNEVSIGIP